MKALRLGLLSLVAAAVPAPAFQAQGAFERSLAVSGPVELDIKTDSGGIVVTEGASGSVSVRATLKAHRGSWVSRDVEDRIREIERNPPIERNGNHIRIGHVRAAGLLRGISMRLEVQTPRETKIVANADSGGIRIDGIAGPVECSTDSGGIRINDVQGSVYARADSGGIEAMRIGGAIDVATDSGGIRLEQIKAGSIRARADSGGADLRLAASGGYDVAVSSDSGGVSVRDLVVRGMLSKRHLEGKLRGGGPLVDIRVDSGHIAIE